MRLATDVWGDGPPLVLAHGFTGSRRTWEPVRALLGTRRRVVALELPGHGASPPPAPASRLGDVARAAVATLAALGIQRADWLGYSLGGRLALHVAIAHPDAVGRLLLESASPGLDDARERSARSAADDALADRLEHEGLPAFVDHWTAQPLFASQRRLDAAVRARERRLRLTHAPGALAAALRAFSVGRHEPLWARLPALAAPTLLVVGADDARYVAIGRAMAARLPRARLAVVPDAGHTVHLENPVPFWSLACGFLDAPASPTLEGTHA